VNQIPFSPSIRAVQDRKTTRPRHAEMDFRGRITPDLAAYIAAQTSFYMATASAEGQPYIQHRGGPAGFLHVLSPTQLGFADFKGNKQYISLGNLAENPKAFLFLMDYAHRRRIKLWGTARVVEDDPNLLQALRPEGYSGIPEQAILFDVTAWDSNCPQHIPQRFEAADVAAALAQRDARIAQLEAQLAMRDGR
jgi:uncharacterized protein